MTKLNYEKILSEVRLKQVENNGENRRKKDKLSGAFFSAFKRGHHWMHSRSLARAARVLVINNTLHKKKWRKLFRPSFLFAFFCVHISFFINLTAILEEPFSVCGLTHSMLYNMLLKTKTSECRMNLLSLILQLWLSFYLLFFYNCKRNRLSWTRFCQLSYYRIVVIWMIKSCPHYLWEGQWTDNQSLTKNWRIWHLDSTCASQENPTKEKNLQILTAKHSKNKD